MKLKNIYICSSCEYESPKWLGRCPNCESWNSFTEDVVSTGPKLSTNARKIKAATPVRLNTFTTKEYRFLSGLGEFDRVLGGGFVAGSLTLLSGEPGIGKSTLTLQIAGRLAKENKVLLVSGEESISQIAARSTRLKINEEKLVAINEFNLETILETAASEKPGLMIIDSIQVISSLDLPGAAGSITQVRYCTERLLEYAKTNNVAVVLIGHITKDGNLAGPKLLEHLVDTVMTLEGDRFQEFRLLKVAKNRFGACSEVGIFRMSENGMNEVKNPSAELIEGHRENSLGSVITVAIEGSRPFLIEVQALTSTSSFGYPKRTANGFDLNRLQILIAVLEKYGKLNLQNQDVFVNVVGGIRLSEPAADLAVLLSIASSYLKKPLPKNSAVFGEVGLSGELRKVAHSEKREKEAQKLGLNQIINSTKFNEIKATLKIFSQIQN